MLNLDGEDGPNEILCMQLMAFPIRFKANCERSPQPTHMESLGEGMEINSCHSPRSADFHHALLFHARDVRPQGSPSLGLGATWAVLNT